MSYADLLINTCTIKRFTDGAQDAYGNPAKTWNAIYTDEPCRISDPTEKEIKVGTEVVIYDHKLFLGDYNVTAQDRVIIDGRTYEIVSALRRQDGISTHHTECYLRIIE